MYPIGTKFNTEITARDLKTLALLYATVPDVTNVPLSNSEMSNLFTTSEILSTLNTPVTNDTKNLDEVVANDISTHLALAEQYRRRAEYEKASKEYQAVAQMKSDRRAKSEVYYEIAVMYPGKVRGVKYYKDTYRVPYPNTLYTYSVLNGVVQSKHCFAVIDDVITPETVLYRFPFGNVGSMGSMCYGNIHLPDCTELSSIDTLVELFLSGDVNDDLYHPSDTAKNCKQFELYQFLEGKKKFPTKILVKDTEYGVKKEIRFKNIWK